MIGFSRFYFSQLPCKIAAKLFTSFEMDERCVFAPLFQSHDCQENREETRGSEDVSLYLGYPEYFTTAKQKSKQRKRYREEVR